MAGPRKARARASKWERDLGSLFTDYDPEVGTWDPRTAHKYGSKFHRSSRASGGLYTGGSQYDPDTGAFYHAPSDTTYYTSDPTKTVAGNIFDQPTTYDPGGRGITPPAIGEDAGTTEPPVPGQGPGPTRPGDTGEGRPGGLQGLTPGSQTGDWKFSEDDLKYLTDLFGPDFGNIMAGVLSGLPAGMKVTGWKEFEAAYPMIQDAYKQAMQKRAIGTAYQSLDELKDDPTLKATANMVGDYMSNPFTFDENTVSLMRSNIADTLANQESAMGERLRAMGATQGIDPSSPLYASLASQAALSRDINMANMERQLEIDMARQNKEDLQQAIGIGSAFGGGQQALLQGAYGNIANLQSGAGAMPTSNPFAGIWQAKKIMDEYNQGSGLSGSDKWMPILAEIIGAGGKVGGAFAGGGKGGGGGGPFG